MPCFSQKLPQQTEEQRREEVKKALTDIEKLIAKGKVKIKVGPQGAAVLLGLSEADRRRLTDTCIIQKLMVSGSEKVKMAITQAEMLAGRRMSKSVIESGLHSHDNGATWSRH
jgi:hypothetical protein